MEEVPLAIEHGVLSPLDRRGCPALLPLGYTDFAGHPWPLRILPRAIPACFKRGTYSTYHHIGRAVIPAAQILNVSRKLRRETAGPRLRGSEDCGPFTTSRVGKSRSRRDVIMDSPTVVGIDDRPQALELRKASLQSHGYCVKIASSSTPRRRYWRKRRWPRFCWSTDRKAWTRKPQPLRSSDDFSTCRSSCFQLTPRYPSGFCGWWMNT
jgi:hypothetical protein